MKRLFIFTLTVLFATTCLLLTHLTAEWDSDQGTKELANNKGEVYGYAYVCTGWDFPYATSYHDSHAWNYAKIAVKYYCKFEATVSGPEEIEPKKAEPEGWIAMDGFAYEDEYFRFNMRGKEEGWYTITGETDLNVKADTNGNGAFDSFLSWSADSFTPFER